MKQTLVGNGALGFRVHSGWAVAIVIAGPIEAPAILDRRRIEIADAEIAGSKQPYHAAQELELKEAEKLIARCTNASVRLAKRAVAVAIEDALAKGVSVSTSGVLTGSGRPLPALKTILSSHPLLHTAEGELFRNAVMVACTDCGLPIFTVKENEVLVRSSSELRISEQAIQQHLGRMGKVVGSPWRQDEKLATRMAWLSLAAEARKTSSRVSASC